MNSSLDELLSMLEALNSMNIPDQTDTVLEEPREWIKNIQMCADEILIDSNGKNIWEYHERLANRGFIVFPGEVDRFGWLSGCIQTKKGIIVYG